MDNVSELDVNYNSFVNQFKYFRYSSKDDSWLCTHPLVTKFEIVDFTAKMYIGEFNQQFFEGRDKIKECDDYLIQVYDLDKIKFSNSTGSITIQSTNDYVSVNVAGFWLNISADQLIRIFISSDFIAKAEREDLVSGKEYTIKELILNHLTKSFR